MKFSTCNNLIFAMAVFFLASFNAAALECYKGSVTDEGQNIGKLVLLSDTPNGSKVWESDTYVRNITCTTKIKENVYFYPFPKISSQTLPEGVKMGLIYDGKDLGTFDEDSGGGNTKTKIDTGWILNKTTATRTFTIQAYLIKTGEINTSKVTGKIHLFQLDGQYGLNPSPSARNYKFSLSQWNQTGTVDCSSSFSGMTFSIASIETDKAFAASSSHSVSTPTLSISCSSKTSGLISLLKNVTGNFAISGSSMSGHNDHFSTNRKSLGFQVVHDGAVIKPGKTVSLTVKLSGGKASQSLPLTISPRLMELDLRTPPWLFKDSETEAISKITPAFTPLSVNTN